MEFLNVIAAALGAFAFGAVWYTAMSKPWIKAAGTPVDATGKPQGNGSPMRFVVGLVAMVIVAGMMRHLFATSGVVTPGAGIVSGLGFGVFVITPWVTMNYAFAMRPVALTVIDGVNAVVGCAIVGAILTLFRAVLCGGKTKMEGPAPLRDPPSTPRAPQAPHVF